MGNSMRVRARARKTVVCIGLTGLDEMDCEECV